MTPSRLYPMFALLPWLFGPACAQDVARSSNPLAAIDKATLRGFVEQPLFEPSRQQPVVAPPYVYVAPPAAPVVEQPPSLRLLGLVEGASSFAAVVHRNAPRQPETLRPGARLPAAGERQPRVRLRALRKRPFTGTGAGGTASAALRRADRRRARPGARPMSPVSYATLPDGLRHH